jgi:uncharacterized protein
MFICDKCGVCCRSLGKSPLYAELNGGNGACKYLQDGGLCSIYEDRPLLCRVDDGYKAFFADIMTIDEYYKHNYDSCVKLRKQLNQL